MLRTLKFRDQNIALSFPIEYMPYIQTANLLWPIKISQM